MKRRSLFAGAGLLGVVAAAPSDTLAQRLHPELHTAKTVGGDDAEDSSVDDGSLDALVDDIKRPSPPDAQAARDFLNKQMHRDLGIPENSYRDTEEAYYLLASRATRTMRLLGRPSEPPSTVLINGQAVAERLLPLTSMTHQAKVRATRDMLKAWNDDYRKAFSMVCKVLGAPPLAEKLLKAQHARHTGNIDERGLLQYRELQRYISR